MFRFTNKRSKSARELTIQALQELLEGYSLQHLRIRFWDGSYWPNDSARPATLVLKHPGSLRKMLLNGSEVAVGEAFLRDDFDVEGNLEMAFELADVLRTNTDGWTKKLKIAYLLKQLPKDESDNKHVPHRKALLSGSEHSIARDQDAIRFHYDLSNDFYSLFLDPQMVYSCAYFENENDSLEKAQQRKLDYICRKLGLSAGQHLLDIGCGWGGLILHAAIHYGVKATGITLSERQAEYARQRIADLKLQDRVNVQIQDYRTLAGQECYDAIVSVGMVEHVGLKNLPIYFKSAYRLLKPGGLFMNHGISTGSISEINKSPSFIEKYVFPDSELFSIAHMLSAAEATTFEIRDVENLREHYTLTLRHWVRQLEAHHTKALEFVSEPIYRIWRLYMAGSAHGFKAGYLAIYQSLLAKLKAGGQANYPLTRAGWYL